MSAKSVVAKQVNRALRPLNFQIIPGKSTDPGVRPYRSVRQTMAEARTAGRSLGIRLDRPDLRRARRHVGIGKSNAQYLGPVR